MTDLKYRPNLTKRKLRAGETVFGTLLTIMNAELVEMLGIAGLDFIIMEGEHGPWDESLILNIVRASELVGVTPTIRLSNLEPDRICRLLDMGVQGIHCSHVASKDEAAELVRVVKLYPQGERGFGRFSRANFFGMLDEREAVEAANAESLVVAQIEDRQGIEHIEEIVQVPGLDVLSVGPSDLSQSYGLPGQYDHPVIKEALDRFHRVAFGSGLCVNSSHADARYRLTSWAGKIQELQSKMPGRMQMTSSTSSSSGGTGPPACLPDGS
ncbi:MAG: siderophore biosynthesis protein SbnG [Chloroflexi bacterium]|nr:siderophore biosynthesis protein SbnG [Chloroflexota bacterium]